MCHEYHLVNVIHVRFAHSKKLRHVGIIFISELCFHKAGTMTANCLELETIQPCREDDSVFLLASGGTIPVKSPNWCALDNVTTAYVLAKRLNAKGRCRHSGWFTLS